MDAGSGDWPFDDPPNCATFTTPQVMHSGLPILLVAHDADDGYWQFLHGDVSDADEPMLVALREVFNRDSTLAEIASLPLGWQATRDFAGGPWRWFRKPPENE